MDTFVTFVKKYLCCCCLGGENSDNLNVLSHNRVHLNCSSCFAKIVGDEDDETDKDTPANEQKSK